MITFLLIIIIGNIVGLAYIYYFNKFQDSSIRINEAEIGITTILNKKFDLLNRAINIIKGNTTIKKDILENIVKLRSRKLNNFEFDKELSDSLTEFFTICDENAELQQVESFKKILNSLINGEEQLTATKKYYNHVAVTYNKMVKLFPSNLIALIYKYKEKQFHKDETDFTNIEN